MMDVIQMYEKDVRDYLLTKLPPSLKVFYGQAASNRFAIPGWPLSVRQQFQFGDLRVEGPRSTVVIEIESAGGVTNLVKYWPFLAARTFEKPLTLAHLFLIHSDGDYVAHRLLWAFVVNRMADDLFESYRLRRGRDWEARLFALRVRGDLSREDLDQVLRFILDHA